MEIYVDRFYEEASKRSVSLPDRSTITLKFVAAAEISPNAGYGDSKPPRVRIVKTIWETYAGWQKEILMFHELGHAVLGRYHTDEKLPNCEFKSMMVSTNQFIVYDSEESARREYYIDELFNPYAPYPSWGGTIKSAKVNVVNDQVNDPDKWVFTNFLQANHTASVDKDVFFSAPNSLHISGPVAGKGMAQWHLAVPFKEFPPGSSILLTFKMKLQNVVGNGAYAFLEAVPAHDKNFNTNTFLYSLHNGTRDWTEVRLILNCYPTGKPDMSVDLYLDGASSGDVWFDDIRVDYFN
jgi:hypothetical protein